MQENKKGKKDRSGIPLVDVAYRRAKAVKAGLKAQDAGKRPKKAGKKAAQPQSRTGEMQELFQSDMSEKRGKKNLQQFGKKSKNSFKSKSRYMFRIKHVYLLADLCIICVMFLFYCVIMYMNTPSSPTKKKMKKRK